MRSRTASGSSRRGGLRASRSSTRTRSPRSQRSRWMRSSSTRDGPDSAGAGGGSGIAVVLQAQLARQPGEGAVQLLAEVDRRAAELGGDGGPVVALVAQLDQLALVGLQPAVDLLQQLARLDLPAGGAA